MTINQTQKMFFGFMFVLSKQRSCLGSIGWCSCIGHTEKLVLQVQRSGKSETPDFGIGAREAIFHPASVVSGRFPQRSILEGAEGRRGRSNRQTQQTPPLPANPTSGTARPRTGRRKVTFGLPSQKLGNWENTPDRAKSCLGVFFGEFSRYVSYSTSLGLAFVANVHSSISNVPA